MASEQEKRDLILNAHHAGKSPTEIAKLFSKTVSRATVFRTVKAYKETGKSSRKAQVREKTVRTAAMKKRIREKVRRNPSRSIRQLAKDEAVSRSTMWRVIRKDLGMFPFKKRRRQLLSGHKVETPGPWERNSPTPLPRHAPARALDRREDFHRPGHS